MYLEPQNDGPNKTEVEPRISVHDVMGSHVLQMHSLLAQELQSFVNVLQAMDTHLAFRRTRLEKITSLVSLMSKATKMLAKCHNYL